MKASELRSKDGEALISELKELLKVQFGLRMQMVSQQLKNVAKIKKVRRDIARIKTIINQRIQGNG